MERSSGRPVLRAQWLGRVPYADGVRLQARLVEARRRREVPDTLLLLEHPAVITLGRAARHDHVLQPPEALRSRGIEIHECGRGGDVTYHGPGQLVGYPVLALCDAERDAHGYLRRLEEALLATAADHGIRGERRDGLTGVWVDRHKLASIGVRISTGWITSHGFALNVTTDLSGFSAIVPCGIRGCEMTSIAELTGHGPDIEDVAEAVAHRLAETLDRRLEREPARPACLGAAVGS